MTVDVFGIVGTTQRGSFRVERAVAEGGFSVVYRAQHGAFRAPVALKCLKVPGSMTPAEAESFLEKLREEAELLFRLSATIPEVVRPLHVDALDLADKFVPFLALEWLEGEALDEMLRRRHEQGQAPMSLHKLVRLLTPIARALSRAHRFPGPAGIMSVIHRDVKPENIFIGLVNGEETVKILDFGIAKAQAVAELRSGSGVDEDVKSAFTPAYGAPEQWAPRQYGPSGPWTDVWGLAMTMVEALAGGRPVIHGEIPQMMAAVLNPDKRPSPRSMGVVVAEEAEQAFLRALEIDPRRRTQDIETFWTDLELAVGLSPSISRRDSRLDPIRDPPRLSPAPLSPRAQPSALTVNGAGPSFAATMRAPDSVPPPALPTLEIPAGRQAAPPPPPTTAGPVSSDRPSGPVSSDRRSGPVSPQQGAPSSRSNSRPRSGAQAELEGGGLSLDRSGFDVPLEIDAGDARSTRESGRRSVVSVPGRASPVGRYPTGAAIVAPERDRNLREILKLPAALVIVGCLIGVVDVAIARVLELPVQIGPVRPVWFSVAFVIGGTLLGFWRVLGDDS